VQVSVSALAVVCGAVPLVFLAAYPWIPETPVFLLRRGDEAAALRSLCLLRAPGPRDTGVVQELAALRASVKQQQEAESGGRAGIRDLVATRGGRRGLIIVMGIGALQQLAGISAVLNYAVLIFQMAGSSLAPPAAACVVAAVQLAGSLLAVVLVDRAGRLPLLYASYGGMALSLAVMGACLCWPDVLPAWLTVLSLSAYILVFALGAGCVLFLILVEVFPARLRALAGPLMVYAISVLAFVVTKYFPHMADAITPHGVFWVFAAFCAAGVVFTRIYIPETKGKPLDDILAELEGFKSSSRSLKQPDANP
jgi:SP family facilitated glucose transporter-like MFS transporter 8